VDASARKAKRVHERFATIPISKQPWRPGCGERLRIAGDMAIARAGSRPVQGPEKITEDCATPRFPKLFCKPTRAIVNAPGSFGIHFEQQATPVSGARILARKQPDGGGDPRPGRCDQRTDCRHLGQDGPLE
jgi:hypothetical protein